MSPRRYTIGRNAVAFAINVRRDNASAGAIRSLWDVCGKLEATPSMSVMDYPPHITLAVYDDLPRPALFEGFDAALDQLHSMTVRFACLGYFEAPHAIILWASPTLPECAYEAHASIHASIGRDTVP